MKRQDNRLILCLRRQYQAKATACRRQIVVLALALILSGGIIMRARAQDDVIYRFENYQEDSGRIAIQTQSGQFNVDVFPWLSIMGEIANDAVSGATPTGYPLTSKSLPAGTEAATTYSSANGLAEMRDNRMGGFIQPAFNFGANHLSPQLSYSIESDYISKGAALNYSRDFNQKNTILSAGWSHDFDTVEPGRSPFLATNRRKDSDEFIIGINQLLGPKTVFTADVTYGYDAGLLADPYKGFPFTINPIWFGKTDRLIEARKLFTRASPNTSRHLRAVRRFHTASTTIPIRCSPTPLDWLGIRT